LALFAAGGLFHGLLARGPVPEAPEDREGLFRGVVAAPAWAAEGARFVIRGAGEDILVRAPIEAPPPPGAPCAVYGTVEPQAAVLNPHGGVTASAGVALRARAGAAVFFAEPPMSANLVIARLRDRVRARIFALFDGNLRGLLAALVLGDYSAVSAESSEGFRRLGLMHVLAISGVHMTILAGITAIAARVLLPHGMRWAIVAVLSVALYAPIAGGSGPVVRASIMSAWGILLVARGRAFDPLHVLSATFLLTSVLSPRTALAPGVVLSYSATFGILAFARWMPSPPARGRRIMQALGVSLFATAATAPSLVAYFGAVPIGGILYSIPAEIVSTFALVPAFAGLVSFPSPVLSDLAWCAAWPALFAIDWLTTRPLPAPSVVLAPEWALAIPIAALSCIPVRRRGLAAIARWAPMACALTLVVLSRTPVRAPILTVLDVGAADALFLELPGATFLVDSGRAHHEGVLARAQAHLGVFRPTLLLTHPDEDHDGCAVSLVRGRRVRELAFGITERDRPHAWLAAAGSFPTRAIARGETLWRRGSNYLRCLHPAPEDSLLEDNERSVVLELAWQNDRVLLMGDLEGEGLDRFLARENAGRASPAQGERVVLKLGHHGSPPATTPALLDLLRPEIALVSTGRTLAPELRDLLERRGVGILATGGSGALRLRWRGDEREICRWRRGWTRVFPGELQGFELLLRP